MIIIVNKKSAIIRICNRKNTIFLYKQHCHLSLNYCSILHIVIFSIFAASI